MFKINYKFLAEMGIVSWEPREIKHPLLQNKSINIDIQPLRFNVLCLVVLQNNNLLNIDLLNKMLKVLELAEQDISLAMIYVNKTDLNLADWQEIAAKIEIWQPCFILQFIHELPCLAVSMPVVKTFSPQHLQIYPADKAKTYKDLLELKAMIKDNYVNNSTCNAADRR